VKPEFYCHFSLKDRMVVLCGYILLLATCAIALSFFADNDNGYPPEETVNPEGPWYTEEFLKENPQYQTDMYYCSEYYKNQQKNK
jgi:hypothetical protein